MVGTARRGPHRASVDEHGVEAFDLERDFTAAREHDGD
jgi:hypothetical protein